MVMVHSEEFWATYKECYLLQQKARAGYKARPEWRVKKTKVPAAEWAEVVPFLEVAAARHEKEAERDRNTLPGYPKHVSERDISELELDAAMLGAVLLGLWGAGVLFWVTCVNYCIILASILTWLGLD